MEHSDEVLTYEVAVNVGKEILAMDDRFCGWCDEAFDPKLFEENAEDDGQWACLECSKDIRNCVVCNICPPGKKFDMEKINGEWFCWDCKDDVLTDEE
jgi:hypothetical protein